MTISLLNIIAKVCEKAVFKYLFNYIRDFAILTLHQSGFVPNDSTVHQLVYLYNTFCKALNDKKDIRIIFCDQTKAFDRVWHDGLIFKLQTIGISGTLLTWFKSYLSGRKQRVVIEGKFSPWGSIGAGVPQGSVLGPLLFLIYINDITENTKSNIKLFADDTTLYVSFENIEEATAQLDDDLSTIRDWANQWIVSFNPTKTKSLLVTLKRNLVPPPLHFDGQRLDEVKCHKHLGIHLNSTLTWKDHITYIAENTNKKLNILSSLSHTLDRKTLLVMYNSFIRPCLEYGNILWSNCTDEEDEILESVQRRAARIISGAIIRTNSLNLYQEVAFETLKTRRERNMLLFFHKIAYGTAPNYLIELLPATRDNRYNLRRQHDFPLIKCRINKYQNSFIPKAITLWNRQDAHLKTIADYDTFKDELIKNSPKENTLYYTGKRKENIIMARLRLNCSNLKGHLYNLHIIDRPECQCGHDFEDSFHFFFICPLYNRPRVIFQNTITNFAPFTLKTVLFGREYLPENTNSEIFQATIKFISESKRF